MGRNDEESPYMLLRRWILVLALPFVAIEAAPIQRHLFQRGGPLTAGSPRAPREIGDALTAAQMDAPGGSTSPLSIRPIRHTIAFQRCAPVGCAAIRYGLPACRYSRHNFGRH